MEAVPLSEARLGMRRAIAEATVVVLSILLAFAIDAWWDDRQLRAEEQDVLEALLSEFELSRDDLLATLDVHERSRRSTVRFLKLSGDEVSTMNIGEIEDVIRFLAYPRTFDPVRGSLDALIGSGKLSIIEDRRLRVALTTFVNLVDDAQEDRDYMGQTSFPVWYRVAALGGPWGVQADPGEAHDCETPRPARNCRVNEWLSFLGKPSQEDLLRLHEDEELTGLVKQHKITAVRYAGELEQVLFQVEDVLALLQANLDQAAR